MPTRVVGHRKEHLLWPLAFECGTDIVPPGMEISQRTPKSGGSLFDGKREIRRKSFEHAFTFISGPDLGVVNSGPNPASGGWDGQFLCVSLAQGSAVF